MSSSSNRSTPAKQAAGAFDVRNVIAALIGFYGIVLVLVGLFGDTPADRERTGDVNANLWAGLAMAVVGAGFILWAWLKPTVVPAEVPPKDDGPPAGH